jgi:hypothetical protein
LARIWDRLCAPLGRVTANDEIGATDHTSSLTAQGRVGAIESGTCDHSSLADYTGAWSGSAFRATLFTRFRRLEITDFESFCSQGERPALSTWRLEQFSGEVFQFEHGDERAVRGAYANRGL